MPLHQQPDWYIVAISDVPSSSLSLHCLIQVAIHLVLDPYCIPSILIAFILNSNFYFCTAQTPSLRIACSHSTFATPLAPSRWTLQTVLHHQTSPRQHCVQSTQQSKRQRPQQDVSGLPFAGLVHGGFHQARYRSLVE